MPIYTESDMAFIFIPATRDSVPIRHCIRGVFPSLLTISVRALFSYQLSKLIGTTCYLATWL